MRLSDLSIRALPAPPKGAKLYYDSSALPGFGVRVSRGGTRTFVLVHGSDRRYTKIGRYPIITLAQARTAAREILAKEALGLDRPEAPPFDDAVELFIVTALENGAQLEAMQKALVIVIQAQPNCMIGEDVTQKRRLISSQPTELCNFRGGALALVY